jgi:hypothetical protein
MPQMANGLNIRGEASLDVVSGLEDISTAIVTMAPYHKSCDQVAWVSKDYQHQEMAKLEKLGG